MEKEERLRSKLLYKLGLYLVKVIPVIISGLYFLNAILSYFDIHIEVFSMIGGMSILPWILLYIYSFILRFCFYHRLFLYYILVNEIVCWYDYKIGVPISDVNYLRLHIVLAGLLCFSVTYCKVNNVCKSKEITY